MKQVRETPQGKAISAYIVLKNGVDIATIQARRNPQSYPDKNDLLKGNVFKYTNEPYQTSIKSDDVREAEIWHSHYEDMPTWSHGFKIEFNGQLIHASKTYQAMKARLARLILKWNLTPIESN